MALPAGVTTCDLTVGPLSDFAGDSYTFTVEWQAVLDGKAEAGNVQSITWEATGQALASFLEKEPGASTGGTITIPLPHVDQPGFIDGTGGGFTMWAYRVTVRAYDGDRKLYFKTKFVQPVMGQTTLDFDVLRDGFAGTPLVTSTGWVTSVNGVTGPIDTTAHTQAVGDARYLRTGIATIIDVGNSIASNGTLSYYDRCASGAISFGSLSYMGWAMPKTFGRFRCKGVSAIGGYTMEQILDELLVPALEADPDFIHLQVFTNSVAGVIAGTQTFAEAQAIYMQIVDAIVDAGIIPIIATVPPINTVTNTGTGLTVLTKINLWLKRLAHSRGWPLADYHTALVDPATNNFVAAYTSDGVHMTTAGAKVMGEVLAATMNAVPSNARSPLWGSYNPNLMQPDCCTTSAAADKWVGSGNTTGGWAFKSIQCPAWKGNSYILTRGSVADYSITAPINTALWVAGHTVRVAFQVDASAVPAGGGWSVQLFNATQSQVICGFTAMADTLTHKSVTQTGCTTTSGSKVVSGAPAGTFRPDHVGLGLSAVGTTGLISAFPANTLVTNVSADGTTVYASANATDSRAGISVVTISGPQPLAIFEFEVQPDMVGDTIYPGATVAGAAGTTLNISQMTIQDITALGVAA